MVSIGDHTARIDLHTAAPHLHDRLPVLAQDLARDGQSLGGGQYRQLGLSDSCSRHAYACEKGISCRQNSSCRGTAPAHQATLELRRKRLVWPQALAVPQAPDPADRPAGPAPQQGQHWAVLLLTGQKTLAKLTDRRNEAMLLITESQQHMPVAKPQQQHQSSIGNALPRLPALTLLAHAMHSQVLRAVHCQACLGDERVRRLVVHAG